MPKIPDNAKCVFEGKLFNVYHWEQELFDGSFATFEMLKRKHTVRIIATQGNDIFYVDEKQPDRPSFKSLISGGADNYDEDPLETAKRELLEETGMISDDWKLFLKTNSLPKQDWPVYTYIAKNCKKITEPNLDAGEKIKVCKTSIDDFCDNILMDSKFKAYDLQSAIMDQKVNARKLEELKTVLGE